MPAEPPHEGEPVPVPIHSADERFQVRSAKVAAGLLGVLALLWWVSNNRAWAAPLVVACIAALWCIILLARKGIWSRIDRIPRTVMIVGLLVGFFLASGGWAYTYGGGGGLALTLEAPSGPVSAIVVNASSLKLNFSFTNMGTERLRFDPGSGEQAQPPALDLFDGNGSLISNPRMPGGHHLQSPPFGGWPDAYIELAPGESWRGTASWPHGRSSSDRPLPAGNYTAHLSWMEKDCSYSWLPCYVGALRSNEVIIQFV